MVRRPTKNRKVEVSPPDGLMEKMPTEVSLPVDQHIRVPLYRRDLKPANLVLSAEDIREFCELIVDLNERAKQIENLNVDLTAFENAEQARAKINELMPIEYIYRSGNGDSMQGLGVPKTEERTFPDDLKSLFVSNAAYAERAVNIRPLNAVEVFLAFEKPSLKIDLQTFPSNPTENDSIVNVSGRDEDWVISAAKKIEEFFKKRQTNRPIIHGSGAYDYIIYLVFLPVVIWMFYKYANPVSGWLEQQTVFLNVFLGIYGLLLSLLLARFLFQYVRWLFPPMEYYKRSHLGASIHRSVASFILGGLFVSATYDLLKALVASLSS